MDITKFGPVVVGDLELSRFTLADMSVLLGKIKDRRIKELNAQLKAGNVSSVEAAGILADARDEQYTPFDAQRYAVSHEGSIEVVGVALGKIGKTIADLPPMAFSELTTLAALVLHVAPDPPILSLTNATSDTSSE